MTEVNGRENAIMQVTYVLNGSVIICCFAVILLHIEKKALLKKNLPTISPLKCKLSGKFQRIMLLMEVSNVKKKVKFPKVLVKMKNNQTFYESQRNYSCVITFEEALL